MRQILILFLAALLLSCGGAPAKKESRTSGGRMTTPGSNTFPGDGYTEIKKDEHPDLYDALISYDYSRARELLGKLSYVSTYADRVAIKFERDGKVATNDALLYYAIKKGDMGLAGKLLKEGADPRLEMAFASDAEDRTEVIEFLIEGGADPNSKDKDGNTFLHKALSPRLRYLKGKSDDGIISYLEPAINKGAKIGARNKSGKTPLGLSRGRLEQYLLSKGASDYGSGPPDSILEMSADDILAMEEQQCHRLLKDYDVKYKILKETKMVEMPVRLKSAVGGIKYVHTGGSKKFSIMDCRLAAALVGWSPLLKRHGVVEIEHMRAYSPGAKVGGGNKVSGHNYALAIDAAYFIFKDKQRLEINKDWKDRRHRADPCKEPKEPDSKAQARLRRITCETGEAGVFNMILTPHYNRAHYDHLHLELTGEVDGYLK